MFLRIVFNFFKRNYDETKSGGIKVILRKVKTFIKIIIFSPYFLIVLFFLLIIYLIKPLILIRFGNLSSSRLGHFAADTELYLCELDAGVNIPKEKFKDFFYFDDVSNEQIAKMWKRKLKIFPGFLIKPFFLLNKILSLFLPYFKNHIVMPTQSDRDVHNLMDNFSPHISFTEDEKKDGEDFLKKFGLSKKSKFVCLIVRDSKYLKERFPEKDWMYSDHRNYEINNFLDAANELTKKGYYIFRMGSKVEKKFDNKNKMIIDYANLKERSDFLDVYLGANCNFCITTSCGFDAIPSIFRRPVAYITVPLQYFFTFSSNYLIITKHHFSKKMKKKLNFSELSEIEIGECEVTSDYKKKDIELIENSPEEIKDFVIEMADRVENKWTDGANEKKIQNDFWENYKIKLLNKGNKNHLHGKLLAKFSISFLKRNPEWLL